MNMKQNLPKAVIA